MAADDVEAHKPENLAYLAFRTDNQTVTHKNLAQNLAQSCSILLNLASMFNVDAR